MKALVLSGGGGFGAYQAGTWLALEESNWSPDTVIGISIGAVNGFVISRAARAADLIDLWRQPPHQIENTNGAGFGFWKHSSLFRSWLEVVVRKHASQLPTRDLHIVMTELPSCAMRVASGTEITERHLLAACALPGILPPVRLNGKFYLDAGTFYHLPMREALATGATDIIAIDLLKNPPCRSIRRARQAALWLRNLIRQETTEPTAHELQRVRLRHVGHARPLGSLRQCFEWDPSRVEALIEAGYRDTLATLRDA